MVYNPKATLIRAGRRSVLRGCLFAYVVFFVVSSAVTNVTTCTFVRCYYSLYSLRLAPEIRIII
ncbi:hypothetical protein Hanom_Chr07g00681471 [Helianthus anomalus]